MRDWDKIVDGLGSGEAGWGDLLHVAKETKEWREEKGFSTGVHNFSEKLMLIVTEISEATDAAKSAHEVLGMFMRPRNVEEISRYGEALTIHARNYVEEWADVMVRTLDLAGSTGLRVWIDKAMPDVNTTKAALADRFGELSDAYAVEAVRRTTAAMEAFRDVDVEVWSLEVEKGETVHHDGLSTALSGILTVSSWAIAGMGENWAMVYAEKMKINEARPAKHGRKR